MAPAAPVPDAIRAARKVLRMVAELHLRGYQRLRISTCLSGSNSHWRCAVTPAHNISPLNGALMLEWREKDAYYTSAYEREFFGWDDVAHATPSRFADVFVDRLPDLVREGLGSDWLYAGWYVEMLHRTYPDLVPVAYYADGHLEPEPHGLWVPIECIGEREGIKIPPPPPGFGLLHEHNSSGGRP